jgi:hypothetical protein
MVSAVTPVWSDTKNTVRLVTIFVQPQADAATAPVFHRAAIAASATAHAPAPLITQLAAPRAAHTEDSP